jgi:hypothetical protein
MPERISDRLIDENTGGWRRPTGRCASLLNFFRTVFNSPFALRFAPTRSLQQNHNRASQPTPKQRTFSTH